jgi:hypothetical protein
MKRCISCGRIIKDDVVDTAGGGKNEELKYCVECLDENGKLKTYDQVAENLAKYLIRTQGLDEKAAENAAKAIASSQPEWDKKQGVYFEKDMKKKRLKTILSILLVIVFFISAYGIKTWYVNSLTREIVYFEKDKDVEITRMVGDLEIHELVFPNSQAYAYQLFHDDPNIFCFSTARWNKFGKWLGGSNLYTYNIKHKIGKKVTSDKHVMPMTLISIGSGESFKDNICLGVALTYESLTQNDTTRYIITLKFSRSALYPRNPDPNSGYVFPAYRNYPTFYKTEYDPGHNELWIMDKKGVIYDGPHFVGELFAWTTNSKPGSGGDSIILYNPFTEREILVTDTMFQFEHSFNDNSIIWMDNRDISRIHPALYCYDIKNSEEYIVSDEKNIGFYDSNNRYILVSKGLKKDYDNRPKNGLILYDTEKREFLEKSITTNIIRGYLDYNRIGGYVRGGEPKAEVLISDSNAPEKTYVAWIEEINNREQLPWNTPDDLNSELLPRIIRVQNVATLGEKPLMVAGLNNSDESQCPLLTTSEYICWKSMNQKTHKTSLWLGRLKDGNDDGIIESICIDTHEGEKIRNLFNSISISNHNIYWSKKSGKYNYNICWVKISDIFPENTNTVGMEE